MITVLSNVNGVPYVERGVEEVLVNYVRCYGHITSLDAWAHEWGINPKWVRCCAHMAEEKGKLQLTRLQNTSGRPYKVTLKEARE